MNTCSVEKVSKTRQTLARASLGFAGIVLALLLNACGERLPQTLPLPSPPLVAACTPGNIGGELKLAIASMPSTFNPVLIADRGTDPVLRLLYSSLLSQDMKTLELRPSLAESWSVAPDQRTWTFKLRAGLRWSDGAPLTAEDVVFTWNNVMFNPEANPAAEGLMVNGKPDFEVSMTDPVTVQVVTREVYAPFLEFFATFPVLPRHMLEPAVRQGLFPDTLGLNTPPERLAASGPYRLKELLPRQGLRLERNPGYHVVDSRGTRLPYIPEVRLIALHTGTEISAMVEGLIDLVENPRPEFAAMLHELRTNQAVQVLNAGIGNEREFICFNHSTNQVDGQPVVSPAKLSWFADARFRQAISSAINRQALAQQVYAGRAEPVWTFISSENPKWFNTNVLQFAYDPAQARSLLASMGLRDRNGNGVLEDDAGNEVRLTLHSNTGNEFRGRAGRLIAENLKEIGIAAEFKVEDFQQLLQRVGVTHNYDTALMGMGGGGVDPASLLKIVLNSGERNQWFAAPATQGGGWQERVEAFLARQLTTFDPAKRKELFDEIQMILSREVPFVYTVAPISYAAAHPNLGNLQPTVHSLHRLTWNIEELYWKK